MSQHNSPNTSVDLRPRRGSVASVAGSIPMDKEQLAEALDKIHSAASASETLTTFNEFTSPPAPSSHSESKGITGDLMQNGLSGLYSRFRGAVGASKERSSSVAANRGDHENSKATPINKQNAETKGSRGPGASPRDDSGRPESPAHLSASSSRIQSPTASSFGLTTSESQLDAMRSSRASLGSVTGATPTTSKLTTSGRPSITPMSRASVSSAIIPTVAPVNVSAFKDGDAGQTSEDTRNTEALPYTSTVQHENLASFSFSEFSTQNKHRTETSSAKDNSDSSDDDHNGVAGNVLASSQMPPSREYLGGDGSIEMSKKPAWDSKSASSALSSLRATDSSRGKVPPKPASHEGPKRPAAIDRITQSVLPGYQASRASSTDRSTAEASPINTSAHNSVRHESFSADHAAQRGNDGRNRTPVTTTNEGAPEAVNARLEQMRKQVLSKEFWMADEICKECFLCGDAFSAFRRKHHCRTCGCIFDSKCTSIITGQRFGVQGSLRVCKTCLDIINRRHDSSGSEDSADDSALPTFFQTQQAKYDASTRAGIVEGTEQAPEAEPSGIQRPLLTPMMAIPATRRIGDSSNRRSAVLEIDAPQLSRPSSSRSLKALSTAGRPMSSSHKRHHSKHNFLGRFKSTVEERAPFQRGIIEDMSKQSRLPAFHDDNIIDPDLAPYMSDEESSGDEQMSIFATMNSGVTSPNFENDRSGFGSLLSAGKKHRARAGEKSVSGISFTSRVMDDASGSAPTGGFIRPNRRRNLSTASNNMHLSRTSPRQPMQSFGNLDEGVASVENLSTSASVGFLGMTRSVSMRDNKAPAIELNNASLHHVRRLLHQLLEDANIPNVPSWEKALVPILLQCTDDVNPNVRLGDDIDIRHYVKLKKIPGGKPGDTAYVSGVIFTKNVALKSMARSISSPRIVIVSFPIEYQRHQQHFMSLEPVIAQEKEFLRNMVNRIASLRPQLLLVQKHISGLALQYLAEANIAVAYNVKQSVIEAVSRCAQTEIISSIDMVALKPVHIGKSAGFDVKTYVHSDIPGRKKTYIYLSGCPKDLGCTIALRGANMSTLSKMKRITEFMVYVVYNLKLETCLMRDEFVLIPSVPGNSGSLSPSRHQASQAMQSGGNEPADPRDLVAAASDKLRAVTEAADKFHQAANPSDTHAEASAPKAANNADAFQDTADGPNEAAKLVSAHESHAHGSHDDQLPEDIPMPTFYSDMVAKHQTKILSASPFVKFMQPYLLMRAREQERRLSYLKRLRDQDSFEEQTDTEKSKPQKFQLIKPEMVHETVQRAPRQIMEVLHAVHDAEYDKALHNYQTQKRQWEIYIQANLNLFDPYSHQNITVLYTVVCTETTVPCAGPELLALAFYNEHAEFDPDCTLGQYVEDLCLSANTICTSNGCERKMSEHHRTYVHGEARITVFVERSPCKIKGLHDSILMWSYCKICQKETQVMPMSESTWKYSLGKYLELSFWSSELRLRAGFCPHDIHRDHLRYFGFRNVAIRIHYDPIDLLEIVVPRTRVTWKVDNDLRLKNDLFTKSEERWTRFMVSVRSRIKGINIDSVAPEKTEACTAEVERLNKLAQEEHTALIRKLQEKYMESKYYEIIPLNRAVRAMQEKVAEWDDAFADFDANFFPSEKDIRRLAALQLKRMFIDRDESTTSIATETTDMASDLEDKSPNTSMELARDTTDASAEEASNVGQSAVEGKATTDESLQSSIQAPSEVEGPLSEVIDLDHERIDHLDLAGPRHMDASESSSAETLSADHSSVVTPWNAENIKEEPLESSLSEKVENLRKAHTPSTDESSRSEVSGIPRPSERGASRRSVTAITPPLSRTQSQPAGTLRRSNPSRANSKHGDFKNTSEGTTSNIESLKASNTEPVKPVDRKLSDRLGLGSMKVHRKTAHSLIPRSVHSKRNESKVSTLAKHFEQLSREFEKERLRDRKQRAAKVTQSRAFPKASSKPIVEVYKDVNEAVEERGHVEEATASVHPTRPDEEATSVVEGLANLNTESTATGASPHPPTDIAEKAGEPADEVDADDNPQNASQAGSDDDGAASDVDHSILDDIIPGAAEIAESLGAGKHNAELPLEIPKHEKSSLMKMLTNFWAERSASGWTPLDYPINAGDHIFADVDVIVREDEPSSLIAFTLNTQDYNDKLAHIRTQGEANTKKMERDAPEQDTTPDLCDDGLDQAEVETSLLRATGTHLSYSFVDGSARMQCKIFFAEQFDAVRRKCGVSDRIVESLSRCLKWDSKGGKTKSVFLKTLDDRLVIKSLSPIETAAFLKFAPAYFNIMAEALFHDLPTVIAKMLGFYQIIIKNPVTGTEIKWDVLVMENLFYDRSPTRIFDLKGSMRNRKIQSTGEQNEVLLDENMVEFIYESPLFAREHSKKLLRAAIFNDTLFLQRNDVMDYSLMVAVDEARKELVVGIIDVVRTYTWDKKLESWIKDRGFAGGGRNRPTVTSPKEYKSRFREAMNRYILQAPNSWHQWQQMEGRASKDFRIEAKADRTK